ncbi:cytoskeleton associated protein 2-like protein [Camelus ferus]|nr:cytoskeleton associated protein 2-like protein [Camelus ferus]
MRSALAFAPGADFELKLSLGRHGAAGALRRRRRAAEKAAGVPSSQGKAEVPKHQTIRPKKDVTNHVALPVKPTRPISTELRFRTANITRSQRPQLEPPKLLGKRLTSGYVSSNPNYSCQEERNKENLSQTSPDSERGPNAELWVKKTQIRIPPLKSQQLSRGKDLARPAMSQRPKLTVGSFNSAIPSTPRTRANGGANGNKFNNSCQQKARTLDSKLKRTLPQSYFLNKTAPKTQAGRTAVNGRGASGGTQTNPNTKKTTAEDRSRKQLEEWQKSKGKIYKRPPMELKTKRKIIEEMNISFWKSMEKEEEEKKAQLELSSKIDKTLAECVQLIEGGVLSNEVFAILSSIPEAEKFAKFWICKAKLLASKGTFDVIALYEEAIRNGATPIQELREVVLNILQDPKRTTEGITSDSLVAETNIASIEELAKKMESGKSCLSPKKREQVTATPQITKTEQNNHYGIKLQIAPIPRVSGMPEVQDMKLITPVRRSTRIERAVSRYPEMLQEHDLVVASLSELLEVEDTECFIFRKNEALPVTLGFQIPES